MEEIATIKKRSNNTALISLIVFALIASAIGVAMFGLYAYNKEVEKRDKVISHKNQIIADQDNTIAFNKKLINSKTQILHSLQQEINELGDSTISIQCSFSKLNGEIDDNGCQMWGWNIWLTGSVHRLNQIEKVYYKVQGSKMKHVNRASVERTNGFLVYYQHHDCLESVKITIQYEGGKMEVLFLNSCERFKGFQVERYEAAESFIAR